MTDEGLRQTYRAEHFTKTSDIYRNLVASELATERHDLRVNNSAVKAQLQWAGQHGLVSNDRPEREDLGAFEMAYNAACGSIARGELGQAEVILKRAKGKPT